MKPSSRTTGLLGALVAVAALACSAAGSAAQGRQFTRQLDPDDIWRPPGYNIEVFAAGLDYPVDLTFGERGEAYVAETGGHTYGTVPMKAPEARILELMPDGGKKVVYGKTVPLDVIRSVDFGETEKLPPGIVPPLTGATFHKGKIYFSSRGRYSTVDPRTGEYRTIIDGLPSWGEFLNAKPIFGPDGKMYFGLATQGNSGVIEAHWIKVIDVFDKPGAHEIPGEDVVLTGRNFPVGVGDPSVPSGTTARLTGVYVPFGVKTEPGQVIKGRKICNGAFYKANPDGTGIERIAWGFRSNFGYDFSPDGRLFTTQNSGNPMPPRGIWFDWESVYEVVPGEWYGWPDFFSGLPVTDPIFQLKPPEDGFVLTKETHRRLLKGKEFPRQPVARLPIHSAAEGMVFGRAAFGVQPDYILVAEMGAIVPRFKGAMHPPHEPPTLSPVHESFDAEYMWPGFRVQLVNPKSGMYTDFLVNESGRPASATNGGGLERPIRLTWGPDGALYVVDFGVIEFDAGGMKAHPGTGVIWRVTAPGTDRRALLPLRGRIPTQLVSTRMEEDDERADPLKGTVLEPGEKHGRFVRGTVLEPGERVRGAREPEERELPGLDPEAELAALRLTAEEARTLRQMGLSAHHIAAAAFLSARTGEPVVALGRRLAAGEPLARLSAERNVDYVLVLREARRMTPAVTRVLHE